MASKRVDLNKRCFYVLSGVSNPLGKMLAIEMCRRFKSDSVVVLIDDSEENLQHVKKEIQFLDENCPMQVVCHAIANWQLADGKMFTDFLEKVLFHYEIDLFELAFIVHNESVAATHKLIEPEDMENWKTYVQQNLYAAVALNQAFLKCKELRSVQKLCVNITSSLMVKPLSYCKLFCSCKQARDMYFRAMAAEEDRKNITVVNYSPGILDTHESTRDLNNNIVDLLELNVNEKLLQLPRPRPIQSTLKLINILEEMSFISGHDVDYYDTFNL